MGDYKIEDGNINGKAHFTYIRDPRYALWYTGKGQWVIGLSSERGQERAYAYVDSSDSCPHKAPDNWYYLSESGSWERAGKGLTIRCRS